MDNLIRLVVGDWSGDGHNITDTSFMKSNLTYIEISSAYRKGSEILGFNLKEDCCHEYEDSLLLGEHIFALRANGIDIKFDGRHEDPMEDEEEGVRLMSEEFVEIYLEICKLGNPDFKYEIFRINDVNVGGYGLMWT